METQLAFFRYSLVGATATIAHYLVLILSVELLHFIPALASSTGAVFGALLAYIGNSHFTFKSSNEHRHALPKFFLVAAIGAIFNGAIVALGTEFFGFHYVISQLIATLSTLLLTFRFNRLWTFQA